MSKRPAAATVDKQLRRDALRDPRSTAEREKILRTGFDIARRTVSKLLRDGPPADWNDMVNAAADAAR